MTEKLNTDIFYYVALPFIAGLLLFVAVMIANAYATDLSYEQMYILFNLGIDFDIISEWEQIYIYDYECRHHQNYYNLPDDNGYKYTIWGECERYINWYYR